MDNRIARHFDGIKETLIPPNVLAAEVRWAQCSAERERKKCDKGFNFLLAEAYTDLTQRLGQAADTIARIAQTTPITIEGILSEKIPPVPNDLGWRKPRVVNDLVDAIGSAAIAAYLKRNREAVDELMHLLPAEEVDVTDSNKTDRERENELKWRLRNLMPDTGWDEKIRAWLQSTTDASEKFPSMPPGHSWKK